MTETCAGSIYSRECPSYDLAHKLEFSSLGSCIPGLDMRICSDAGNVTGPNEAGSLQLHGDVLFQEYFNNPTATAKAFTADGWFITDDRALIDSNGRLRLVGLFGALFTLFKLFLELQLKPYPRAEILTPVFTIDRQSQGEHQHQRSQILPARNRSSFRGCKHRWPNSILYSCLCTPSKGVANRSPVRYLSSNLRRR